MTPDNKHPIPDFRDLEKETLKELSLDTLKSALVQSFKKLHQEQLEIFEDKLSNLEDALGDKLQGSVEKHIRQHLKEIFPGPFGRLPNTHMAPRSSARKKI